MVKILFSVAGDKQIEREILRVGAYAGDATPAFRAIGDLMIAEEKLQFATQGGHASGGWKPLKPATVERKQRLGLRPQILQETGALIDSLTVKGNSEMVFEPSPTGITFGSKLSYAEAHQNPKPGSHLPRRRPIELTESARREIVKVLQRYILTGGLPA